MTKAQGQTQREPRKSEKILTSLWIMFPNLQIATWYPLPDEAIQTVEQMQEVLTALKIQLENEKRDN